MVVAPHNNNLLHIDSSVQIQVLKAAAGRDKTGTCLQITARAYRNERSIFAVRTIETGTDIQRRLEEQFEVPAKHIKRIDSEECDRGYVLINLEEALKDGRNRIIICTHQALVSFGKWHEYDGKFTLVIDELPEALELKHASFGINSIRGIAEAYGICENEDGYEFESIDQNNQDALNLIDAINENPSIFQAYSSELFDEDNTILEDQAWSRNALDLFRVAKSADSRHIHAAPYTEGRITKICISAVKKSEIFYILDLFTNIKLTTMLFDDHIFKRIGEASGVEFVDFDWEHQGKRFDNSSNVTFVVMTDMDGMASRSQMERVDSDEQTLFERAIRKLVSLDIFQPQNAAPLSERRSIMLYTNEVRKKQIKQMKLSDRFEFLPYCTHGLKDWQSENLFAAFLTFRWRESYNIVGKRFAEDLGIPFEKLKDEYNFTQMIEPIAQAITRGVVRDHTITNVKSWIALPDLYIARVLKDRLFPEANINTDYMVSVSDNIEIKAVGRPSTWQSVALKEVCTSEAAAKWVYRNMKKINDYFGRELDCTNPIDSVWLTWYLSKHAPHRTKYPYQATYWDMGSPVETAA